MSVVYLHRGSRRDKRSRDLRGGRWSWTLTFAQKRSWVGRWSWAEQVGRLLLRVVQVVHQQRCNGHCLSDCPAQQLKEQLHVTLPLFWRRSTVSPVFFGRFPRSSQSPCPLPTLSPSLIGHPASVDVKQHEKFIYLFNLDGSHGMWRNNFISLTDFFTGNSTNSECTEINQYSLVWNCQDEQWNQSWCHWHKQRCLVSFIWVVCNKFTTVWAPTKNCSLADSFSSGPYGVTKYDSSWRKDWLMWVVNQCLEFAQSDRSPLENLVGQPVAGKGVCKSRRLRQKAVTGQDSGKVTIPDTSFVW